MRKRPEAAEAWSTPSKSLRVARLGSQFHLTWDRKSPLIRRAQTGRLLIEDGQARHEFSLDVTHLQRGSITYAPVSGQVRFQVDLSAPGWNDFSESVTVGRVAPPPPVPAAAVSPERPPAPIAPPPVKPERVVPVPSPKLPAPAVEPQPAAMPAAAPAAYEPPRPLKEVAPVLPSALRPVIVRPVTVEVEVTIDAAGSVTAARAVAPYLAGEAVIEAALHAARLWKFEPARRGNVAVAGTTILRFKFNPRG